MNHIDDQLKRLFHAAALAPTESVSAPAYGLQTRVVTAWRAVPWAETGFWDPRVLVRGMILASLIMVASFVPALNGVYEKPSNPFADFLQLTDSTVSSDEIP